MTIHARTNVERCRGMWTKSMQEAAERHRGRGNLDIEMRERGEYVDIEAR